jgi:antitoxin HicB
MLAYRVKLTRDDNETILVTCPALPEVTTFGEDRDDALRHAVDAIEEALAARIARGEAVPAGNARGALVRLPALTALKVELYSQLRHAGIRRAELQRRLGWNRESVDRLFRLDHASRLDQIEQAFRALGRAIDIHIKAAA